MQGGHRGETGKTTVLLGFCRIECRGGRDGNYCVIGVLCGLDSQAVPMAPLISILFIQLGMYDFGAHS